MLLLALLQYYLRQDIIRGQGQEGGGHHHVSYPVYAGGDAVG